MNIQKLADRKDLTFITGLNPSENKPVKNVESLKNYLLKNVLVGLELELDWKNSTLDDRQVEQQFGVMPTCYHSFISCDNCSIRDTCSGRYAGNSDIKRFFCHTIVRKNGIISIQEDGSINGLEFLFQGTNETTQEFIEKLPIRKLSRYFKPSYKTAIHTHILMPFLKKEIPSIILKNLWQLYRKYYVAIVYLSGCTDSHIIRDNDYAQFSEYRKSALNHNVSNLGNERDGLYFCNRDSNIFLDIELRTFDSSLNAFHIALCRFLTKALFIRAVELSEFGLVKISYSTKWNKMKRIIEKLNEHETDYSDSDIEFMRDLADELLIELNHLLSPLEKRILKEFINLPIWKGNIRVTSKKPHKKQLQALTKQITMLVKVKAFFEESREEYYKKLANTLNTTPNYIRNTLSKIGATWNKEINTFEIQ